jgi:hypothetical protein
MFFHHKNKLDGVEGRCELSATCIKDPLIPSRSGEFSNARAA